MHGHMNVKAVTNELLKLCMLNLIWRHHEYAKVARKVFQQFFIASNLLYNSWHMHTTY